MENGEWKIENEKIFQFFILPSQFSSNSQFSILIFNSQTQPSVRIIPAVPSLHLAQAWECPVILITTDTNHNSK